MVHYGASYHFTRNWKCFSSYKAEDDGFLKMGNEGACRRIVGIGDVRCKPSTGCRLLLSEVPHVSEVRLNLMFATRLDDEGYASNIRNDTMKFFKGKIIVARA